MMLLYLQQLRVGSPPLPSRLLHSFATGLAQLPRVLRYAADLLRCNQVRINMPQLKRIPEGLSIDLTSFSSTPPFASLSAPPSPLPLPPPTSGLSHSSSLFPFCFSVSSANLASLTLHTMKPAHGKRDEEGITSSDSRCCRCIYLAPPWELWLLTHLRLQQLWGI